MATSQSKIPAARKISVRKRKKRIPVRAEISELHKDLQVLECIEIAGKDFAEVPLKYLGREIKRVEKSASRPRKRSATRTA
jgi:hypothetical protein